MTPRLNTLHGCVGGQRAGIVGSWRERQGNAAAFKAGSAKHPCVHEIRVSTSDSCCWVVTVKQIMSVGGSSEIPLSCIRQWLRGSYSKPYFLFYKLWWNFLWDKFKGSQFMCQPVTKKWVKIYSRELCFLELQTVKFKLLNGSGCHKEDLMVLGNGVIIVIQDRDAYCHRQGVRCKWKRSYSHTVSSKTSFLIDKNFTSRKHWNLFTCNLEWKYISQTVICCSWCFFLFSLQLTVFVGLFPNWTVS